MQQVLMLLQTQRWQLTNKKLILPILLFVLLGLPSTHALTKAVLADAFWQVSAFVAATLIGYHFISQWLSHYSWLQSTVNKSANHQVIFASLLGSLPGCGGAIIVVTQFVRRQMSFGALVAVLTATMGDAAFLLLARHPMDGIWMIVIGAVVGSLSGIAIDRFHGTEFMRPSQKPNANQTDDHDAGSSLTLYFQGQFWRLLFIPAAMVALLTACQLDIDRLFALPAGSIENLGMYLAIISTLLWSLSHSSFDYQGRLDSSIKQNSRRLFEKAAQDTNFVSSWVIIAFLLFELTLFFTGFDLSIIFSHYLVFIPLIAALVGLLPGCGPQILVTSLYIQGVVPFSAQIANGLSNDGDALFPAIALAPKAAMIATLYSIVPAIILSYSYFFLFE